MSVSCAAVEALRKLGPTVSFAFFATLLAGLIANVGACTDPLFTDDAGHDGGDGEIDPIRKTWVGRFATRSYLFSYDSPLKTTARLLTLAQIKPTADGGLVLEEELCRFEGSWSFFVTGQLRVDFPKTKLSTPLTFDSDHFSSTIGVATVGYDKAPAMCDSGATTTNSSGAQSWLTDTCDCPRDTSTPPATARDCRLTDPDDDEKPGITFNLLVETSMISFHVAQEERLRLVGGYQAFGRLYADREFLETTKVIDCVVDGTQTKTEDCPPGNAKACPNQYNKVELVPVKDSYDCAKIMEQEQALFAQPRPEYPGACPAAVTGSP